MSADLFQNADGANYQAKAVLAYLSARDGIESSWSKENKRYEACPKVARWENCREQGYVVSLRSADYQKQINIAFFEHRNSDEICAVVFDGVFLNSPNFDNIPESHPYYHSKWDVNKSLGFGKAHEMADFIFNELTTFWNNTAKGA
jgi:hypothetical protein